MAGMTRTHRNDADLIRTLLVDPGTWVVVGLSSNTERTAYGVSRWMHVELGASIVPVHPRAEAVHGAEGYASIDDIPEQHVRVVDCFVNSEHVGAVVDDVIRNKDRLQVDAVWLQLGVVDEAAAARARAAGLGVVMDTCPRIEWPRLRQNGVQR